MLYSLPTCQQLLECPAEKEVYKKLVKTKILDYWQTFLREEAKKLSSLKYFKSDFDSLAFPSKAYLAAGSSHYEVAKLNIQLKMLSGHYRTSLLARHWSDNKTGICMTGDHCQAWGLVESICHIITSCIALEPKRQSLKEYWIEKESNGPLSSIIPYIFHESPEDLTQFILDPLTNPQVISLVQSHGNIIVDKICYLTRTFCFSLHRERKILLGTWVGSGYPAPKID